MARYTKAAIKESHPLGQIRRIGNVYCGSGCGSGCTWADYQEACIQATRLARRLGPGWRPYVHENLGWHYKVISPDGTMKVCPNSRRCCLGKPYSYTAFFGGADCVAGGRWAESARTPEAAIRKVLGVARGVRDEIEGWLTSYVQASKIR